MLKKRTAFFPVLIAIILSVSIVIGINMWFKFKAYKEKVAAITVSEVDLSKVADGSYKGSLDVDYVAVEVEVTVKNHKIEKINLLKHRNDRGKKAEAILKQIIEKQSLKVDAVSGATASSRVILKSVETALLSGIR